jgi:hypothetical protein
LEHNGQSISYLTRASALADHPSPAPDGALTLRTLRAEHLHRVVHLLGIATRTDRSIDDAEKWMKI